MLFNAERKRERGVKRSLRGCQVFGISHKDIQDYVEMSYFVILLMTLMISKYSPRTCDSCLLGIIANCLLLKAQSE